MLTIKLNDLYFYSFHGLYEEEKIAGGEFVVNVVVEYLPQMPVVTSLEETVDYAAIYTIVKEHMQQPTPLLETLAMKMVNSILERFPVIDRVEVSVKKVQPPIKNYSGSTETVYSRKRN